MRAAWGWSKVLTVFVLYGAASTLSLSCRPSNPDTHQPIDAKRGGPPPGFVDTTVVDDGQWLRPGKDYQGTRFSGLTDINVRNVATLQVKATYATGNVRGHEAAPIVAGGTMFIVTPFPNDVVALDLTKPGFPVKWKYRPKPSPAAQGVACCDLCLRLAHRRTSFLRRCWYAQGFVA